MCIKGYTNVKAIALSYRKGRGQSRNTNQTFHKGAPCAQTILQRRHVLLFIWGTEKKRKSLQAKPTCKFYTFSNKYLKSCACVGRGNAEFFVLWYSSAHEPLRIECCSKSLDNFSNLNFMYFYLNIDSSLYSTKKLIFVCLYWEMVRWVILQRYVFLTFKIKWNLFQSNGWLSALLNLTLFVIIIILVIKLFEPNNQFHRKINRR